MLLTRFHPAPLKEIGRLRFRAMTEADREVYADVVDEDALIAYTDGETWIIEGDMVRIIHIDQQKLDAKQQIYVLEQWGTHFGDAALLG